MSQFDFLYDFKEETSTRYVCFIGKSLYRFDLAITTTTHFYGKNIVMDMQTGKSAVMGSDDLAEDGYLQYVYQLNDEQAEELKAFLIEILGDVHFTDIG